ncbi:hypothetical protein BG011_007278 [Mortierella polycephala]|uniref:Uncharacterized protein n=1 Tax=Mortierella polycephala TaxID=41804 RepID=A0A9P6TYX5_9FUNG|nr:hypothetical protein BG011_007278 [Mortierella polycephala]
MAAWYAYAYLSKVVMIKEPEDQESQTDVDVPEMYQNSDIIIEKPRDATTPAPALAPTSAPVPAKVIAIVSVMEPAPEKAIYHSLAVRQKAIYRPTFKFRRWVKAERISFHPNHQNLSATSTAATCVTKGISGTPWGPGHRVCCDSQQLTEGRRRKYRQQREDANKVVIAVGLGQFSTKTRLSSLYGSFLSFFVQKVRPLGYIVVGIYLYRGVMAAHNMCNVVHDHLLRQQRPLYLQPTDNKGWYPWMQGSSSQTDGGGNSISNNISSNISTSTSTSTNTSNIMEGVEQTGGRKRAGPSQ